MLKVGKIKANRVRKVIIGMFVVGMSAGYGTVFTGMMAGTTVNAASVPNQVTGAASTNHPATTYSSTRLSGEQAYKLYVVAAFAAASGVTLYSATYVTVRRRSESPAQRSSQYASRFYDHARTTY